MKRLLLIVLPLLLMIGCDDKKDDATEILVIEISDESYDTYPAVWFSPSTGEIIAVETETPPETKYRFWVEPNDPEFQSMSYDSIGANGVQFIGTGSNYFDENPTNENGNFYSNLLDCGSLEFNNVFYIKTEEGNCLIKIISLRSDDNYLKFKWRAVSS